MFYVYSLAVKSISGDYYLHGHLHAESAGLITVGGAEFLYVRHESGMETLATRGPLTEPIVVEVCVIYLSLTAQNCHKSTLMLLIDRDVKTSRPVWPRGQIIRPRHRPRSIWPRPRLQRPRFHGIWPRPRSIWPRGLEHDINHYLINIYNLVINVHFCCVLLYYDVCKLETRVSEVQRLLGLKSYLVRTLAEIIDHL